MFRFQLRLPSVSCVMLIAFASHTLPGGGQRTGYQTGYKTVTKNIFRGRLHSGYQNSYKAVTKPLYQYKSHRDLIRDFD